MAFKVFPAPTGSGNTVFEGKIFNGYTSPDGRRVRLQFFSNDRGYTAATYRTDREGAKALRVELQSLLEAHQEKPGTFEAGSNNKNFKLLREMEGAPLILVCNGNDRQQGRSFHRGGPEAMKALLDEFEQVLQALDEVAEGPKENRPAVTESGTSAPSE